MITAAQRGRFKTKNVLRSIKNRKTLAQFNKTPYLCNAKATGAIAQLVEQRTENPCVPGSIPGGTTQAKIKPLILQS